MATSNEIQLYSHILMGAKTPGLLLHVAKLWCVHVHRTLGNSSFPAQSIQVRWMPERKRRWLDDFRAAELLNSCYTFLAKAYELFSFLSLLCIKFRHTECFHYSEG